MVQWLAVNWVEVVVPLLALGATFAVGLWLRKTLTRDFENRARKAAWQGRISQLIIRSASRPFLFWFLILGVFIAIESSILPEVAKIIAGQVVASLFVLSLGWVAVALSEELLELYLPKIRVPKPTVDLAISIVIITFLVGVVLVDMAVWGIPTTPFLIIVAIVVLVGIFASRNFAPNVFAAIHMWNTEHVKAGDYIRLETGEEGFVTEINWNSTHIKTMNKTHIILPNSRLLQSKFINHGQPEKITREVFTIDGHSVMDEFPSLASGGPDTAQIPVETGGKVEIEEKSILSEREKEIAQLISEGISNREIADRLFISENTVKVHVKNILKKLELRNRQQLAAYTALRNWTSYGEAKKPEEHS